MFDINCIEGTFEWNGKLHFDSNLHRFCNVFSNALILQKFGEELCFFFCYRESCLKRDELIETVKEKNESPNFFGTY